MKIHKILYYLYIHVQGVKTYNWTVHEYKCLFLAFILLRIERERERVVNEIWVQRKNVPKVTYLIFDGVPQENFLLSRATRLCSVFNTGLKDLESFVSQLIFCLQPGVKWLWFVCPLWTLLKNYISSYLLPLRGREPHFRFGVPANHLASLSFPFRCPATWGH